MKVHTILYVCDQQRSVRFYRQVLGLSPTLDVPGMTEFQLTPDSVLGIMPLSGIKKLLGQSITDLQPGTLAAELYLVVDEPEEYHRRALEAGARELSPFQQRDWGHSVAYSQDADGYVLAFAR